MEQRLYEIFQEIKLFLACHLQHCHSIVINFKCRKERKKKRAYFSSYLIVSHSFRPAMALFYRQYFVVSRRQFERAKREGKKREEKRREEKRGNLRSSSVIRLVFDRPPFGSVSHFFMSLWTNIVDSVHTTRIKEKERKRERERKS